MENINIEQEIKVVKRGRKPRRTTESKNDYVTNSQLYPEIKKSFERGELTLEAILMLQKMIERIQRPFKYEYDGDKEDVASGCMLIILEKWHKFDLYKDDNPNPFSFYSSMIFNGLFASFNELTKGRKDSISINHIMSEDV